jgi:REP element-mobilizing transposase RayT
MSEKRKTNYEGVFFLTFTVEGWIDVFTREIYCEILTKNLIYCQQKKGIEIFAYVIMSNHMHIIVRRNGGFVDDWIRDYKSYTAKIILDSIQENINESRKKWLLYMIKFFANASAQNKEFKFWQKTNHPTEIYSADVMKQKIDYIHLNPVRAGLVTDASYYKYSSLNPDNGIKITEA